MKVDVVNGDGGGIRTWDHLASVKQWQLHKRLGKQTNRLTERSMQVWEASLVFLELNTQNLNKEEKNWTYRLSREGCPFTGGEPWLRTQGHTEVGVLAASLPTFSGRTIKTELLLAFDILVTTLRTRSLCFNPQITSSDIINAEHAWRGFVKQAVSFLGGPSRLPQNCFHDVSFLSTSKGVGNCMWPLE